MVGFLKTTLKVSPRPCGRGGFKLSLLFGSSSWDLVPAHAGGVDLSLNRAVRLSEAHVPAHAGGVDLSNLDCIDKILIIRPRPCGRGGFKLKGIKKVKDGDPSPPMRAGWI